ncbi:hypothetical protein F8M49_30090 [Rhodococcus zopfii]|uniref:Tail terminator n=1 Tax=Rhodococcus zopfii TaxID=43772 RepID=A0ABU3WJS4_9NOCA|nr:hypothetical protein [Rhodococcus zopfii]MDV2478610.1 hypothetical protein [Rhodococcus zopfii]
MVVELDETLFPDIQEVLMVYLAPLGETDTEPPVSPSGNPDDVGIGIQINRVGGHNDGFSDYPRVQITCHHPDPRGASLLARKVANRLENIAGEAIDVEDEPKPICIDSCRVDTPPESEPYENPDARREVAFYALSLQKPWRR